MGIILLALESWAGGSDVGLGFLTSQEGTTTAEIFFPIFYLPHVGVCDQPLKPVS